MDAELARIVLACITASGAVVWLIGLKFLFGSRRSRNPESGRPDGEGATAEEQIEGWLSGAAVIEGEAGALAARAVRLLAQGNLGPIKVVEKADDRVRFERAGAGVANQAPGQWFRRGELRFTRVRPGQSRVSWFVEPAAMAWLLWLGSLFQALGLVALVAGYWLVDRYLATAAEPAMRWQTLQMLQAIHFLWPPFLFGALYRSGTRSVAAQFEALAHNLPYCPE